MEGIDYTIIDGTNAIIVEKIFKMFIPKGSSVYDITWGKGQFWKWDIKDYTIQGFDKDERDGCIQCDWFNLPNLGLEPADVVVFDPPFITRPQKSEYTLKQGYGHFRHDYNMVELFENISPILSSLTKKFMIFKIMDTLYGGKPYWYHFDAYNKFSKDFYLEDMVMRINKSVPISPNMLKQKHFRKNHTYFMIFIKNGVKL